jgi:type IV secretory pathway TrbF-like protein
VLNLFRRERRSPNVAATAGPPDPAREFESLWDDQRERQFHYFCIALGALALAGLTLVAYARLAQSSRLVPFLYLLDRSGEVLPMGMARPLPTNEDTIVYQGLATFITNVRAVYKDDRAQRAALNAAYVYLPADNPEANSRAFLDAYLSQADNDPRNLAANLQRTAEIVAITRVPIAGRPAKGTARGSASTWRVRWRETSYPSTVGTPTITIWEAFLAVRLHPKRDLPDAFDPNPFGIWIDTLSWNRLTAPTPAT